MKTNTSISSKNVFHADLHKLDVTNDILFNSSYTPFGVCCSLQLTFLQNIVVVSFRKSNSFLVHNEIYCVITVSFTFTRLTVTD